MNIIYYRGRKLDKERFNAVHIYKMYNIPNQGRNKGLITRNVQSNKCQGNIKNYFIVMLHCDLFIILIIYLFLYIS